MTAWIETNPYMWHEPIARDLHQRLVDTFYDPEEVRNLVRAAKKPDASTIDFRKSIRMVWVETLDRGTQQGGLGTLLRYIVDSTSAAEDLKTFVAQLLADKKPAAAPSVGARDAPAVHPVREALLFEMDLTEAVGDVQPLVDAVGRVMKWRSSVCHLLVLAKNGMEYNGTGTLLVGGRVLTNHHLAFPDGNRAVTITVAFDYEKNATRQTIAGDVATIRDGAPDDWATFALTVEAPATATPLDLAANQAVAQQGERAFILQHPGGREKRLAFVRNRISEVSQRTIHYITDTEPGSSGSPVFNAQAQLIAIHRAGGDPQKFVGVAPVKHNEGVRIDAVAAAILSS